MSLTMYQLTIPAFIRGLANLRVVLLKAKGFSAEQDIDEGVLLNARLFPTMFPLVRQVQSVCDQALRAAAHLAGVEPEVFEDDENSFDGLLSRVEATQGFLRGLDAAQIDGSEDQSIGFQISGAYKMTFPSGHQYVQSFALPNFYFHLTTAYAILRHNGVGLGKGDFLGDMGADVTPA